MQARARLRAPAEVARMLLDVHKETAIDAPQQAAWGLLRDVQRLSGCIPKISDVRALEADKRYSAVVADKLGPFSLQVPVEITVQSVEEPRRIVAELSGNDSRGQARIKGTLQAVAEPSDGGGSHLTFEMRMEILGKLATLGAIPIRRRADEVFREFVSRVRSELESGPQRTGA